jgi:hypothetical protein
MGTTAQLTLLILVAYASAAGRKREPVVDSPVEADGTTWPPLKFKSRYSTFALLSSSCSEWSRKLLKHFRGGTTIQCDMATIYLSFPSRRSWLPSHGLGKER